MGSGWSLAVASLSSRQAVSRVVVVVGGVAGWGCGERDKDLSPREGCESLIRLSTWVSRVRPGSQEARSPAIQTGLGSEPVQRLSPVAEPQLNPSCSQGLYTSPWKLSRQWSSIQKAWTAVPGHLCIW